MKNIVYYSAIILIISCQPKFNESKSFFEFEEEISFASNDMASTNPGMIQLVDTDSGEYVFLYNHIIKKIQITEFPSGRNVLNIPLEFEEEKRARRFTGATLIAKDTIGVTFYPPAIGLINFSGDLIQFEPLNKESYNVTHIGNGSYTPLIKERNEIFLYDKYRDVFYRIFLPGYDPIELLSIENLSLLERSRPFTGVMVLDKDLNVLQEFVFEKFEVHSSDNFLVGREGLYISTNNMNRDDFSDEFYRYKILRINLDK